MKHLAPPITHPSGLEIPARCSGCPSIARIVSAALAQMGTGTPYVHPSTQFGAPRQAGSTINHILDVAQTDIHNLSQSCPGM